MFNVILASPDEPGMYGWELAMKELLDVLNL